MYEIYITKTFKKHYSKRIPKKLDEKLKKILQVLQKWPPFDKSYNVHVLKWEYYPYYSINLTGDYRVIFDIDVKNKKLYLLDVGTHSQLYW